MGDSVANTTDPGIDRTALEAEIARDLRALTAVSEQVGHVFARENNLRPNDFRALMHVATADAEGTPVTAGQLSKLMGISAPAVTYLIERMIDSGHLERIPDAADRRRVHLRYTEHGMAVAAGFFGPLGARTRAALAELPDADLRAAHRVLVGVTAALREFHAELPAAGGPVSE
ncbi:MarR family winged helix-turn-helix transcriptional regulator [Nocardia bhagyanarayanae]|uniref:MarR family transcriptional regulator n=1 Tax=Nocardia bhagyanarayanae TaxID=1215925 RepID=A0A543FHA1_9NOCA|nr:MarR family winged helix-turn-helix transcriptional regulator [Nocardia bhagyanarayanae]TQM33239.1 MarR family transcriptional regulator [Nocardia bhagyanarayanae]